MDFKFLFGKVELALYEDVWGFCFFDKYCYTSFYGWEILKDNNDN